MKKLLIVSIVLLFSVSISASAVSHALEADNIEAYSEQEINYVKEIFANKDNVKIFNRHKDEITSTFMSQQAENFDNHNFSAILEDLYQNGLSTLLMNELPKKSKDARMTLECIARKNDQLSFKDPFGQVLNQTLKYAISGKYYLNDYNGIIVQAEVPILESPATNTNQNAGFAEQTSAAINPRANISSNKKSVDFVLTIQSNLYRRMAIPPNPFPLGEIYETVSVTGN